MDRFLTAWQLVAKQSFAHWKLLSAVVVGVVLATTIMSGTVVYFDALRDLALDNILGKRSDQELDILQRTARGPVSYEEYERVDAIARRESDARIGWAVTDRLRVGKSQTFFLVHPGNEANAGQDNARAYFAFAPRLYDHATIVAGESPRESGTRVRDDVLEVEAIIPSDAAELFGVAPGDRLVAVPPRTEEFRNITVLISGVFERDDPDHRLWRMERDFLNSATGPTFRTTPFHVSERTFMEVLGPATRRMSGVYSWLLVVDRDRLTANNAERALSDVVNMNRVLGSTLGAYRQTTELDDALREYHQRLFFSKLPMFVVFSLIAVVILYYVAILSNLAVEDRKTEIALLRSRGATSGQIMAVFAIEGGTIAVAAFVLGPLLAMAVVSLLGFAPAFSDLTDSGRLPAVLSTNAFLLSLLGGLLAFFALMAPAIQAARLGVTRSRQLGARPDTQPRFQRYYVDVALLLIGMMLLYQLNHQGSVVARNLVGEVEANQLFIILPGFIMIAAAIVILRLFPLAMKAGSGLLGRWLPVGPALGVWQMARDASHYSRLSLLLVLTAGLGIFAASFGGTLDRSFRERVMFSTGSDFRLEGFRTTVRERRTIPSSTRIRQPRAEMVESYERVAGVELASPVLRGRGRDLTTAFGETFVMLAVDPDTFPEVAWFRDDFADESMHDLVRSIKVQDPPQGIVLPDDAVALQVRFRPDRRHASVSLTARVVNGRGQHFTYDLGNLTDEGWSVRQVYLGTPAPAGPLVLTSLRVHETVFERTLESGALLIDDISVTRRAADPVVIETFDEVDGWAIIRAASESKADGLQGLAEGPESSSRSALFSWTSGRSRSPRGIFHGSGQQLFPVLANKAFTDVTGHSRGDSFEITASGYRLPVILSDTISMFPTITDLDEPLLVGDWPAISRYANLSPVITELMANEVWISTPDDGSGAGLSSRLNGIGGYSYGNLQDRSAQLASSKIDPLVEAGWKALLFIAFSAVLLLSSMGFLIHAYVSFRSRRLQYALLRTVGASMRQLMTMVWLEQTLVVVVGLGLGTWLGGRLGDIILPFLAHDDFGGRVMPPYRMEVGWEALLISYAGMVAVFAIIIMSIVWLVHRISLQRTLRLGEL